MTLIVANIARVAAVSYSLLQVKEQIRATINSGARVSLICSAVETVSPDVYGEIESLIQIPIARKVDPIADVISLCRLCRIFWQRRFDIIHSTTPKAGLLCAIAGWLTRVPIRVHTFTGQPWATKVGLGRELLKLCDWIVARLNTHCYADSPSQKAFLVDQGIASSSCLSVLGSGSLAGVDLGKFDLDTFSADMLQATRVELGIPANARIILFVGRLNADKGLYELYSAFSRLCNELDDVWLLMVGPVEDGSEEIFRLNASEQAAQRIVFVGSTPVPERYMAASYLLCLPSYREGFGSVIIEAGSMSVPSVGTNIYGVLDAIVDRETGLLVKPRDVLDLYRGLKTLLDDDQLRQQMGASAQIRVRALFDSRVVAKGLVQEYERLLAVARRG